MSQCSGKHIQVKNNGCTAARTQNFNHGLVFSADPLRPDEFFEVSPLNSDVNALNCIIIFSTLANLHKVNT